MPFRIKNPALYLCAFAAALLPRSVSAASLNAFLSAPGVQSTYIVGAKTENFNALPPGVQATPYVSSIGTYLFSKTSGFAVVDAGKYGGANGSDYVSVGTQSESSVPVTLALKSPATYFGFWWSAGDPNNALSFYWDNTLLARVRTADVVGLLNASDGVVTAVDGKQYAKSRYYGNPNNGRDGGEPFAYVNVFADDTAFNKVVFDNSGTTSTGFETDNQSAYWGAVQPAGASMLVKKAPAVAITLTPEPASVALSGMGVLSFALLLRRRKAS